MTNITLYKQIHPCQCSLLVNLGYKSLINLRFDDECDNQPTSQAIAQSADSHHLCYAHLPIDNDCLNSSNVQHFAKLVHELPKPVMVFCGTGTRAKRLYQSAKIIGLLD